MIRLAFLPIGPAWTATTPRVRWRITRAHAVRVVLSEAATRASRQLCWRSLLGAGCSLHQIGHDPSHFRILDSRESARQPHPVVRLEKAKSAIHRGGFVTPGIFSPTLAAKRRGDGRDADRAIPLAEIWLAIFVRCRIFSVHELRPPICAHRPMGRVWVDPHAVATAGAMTKGSQSRSGRGSLTSLPLALLGPGGYDVRLRRMSTTAARFAG
jgi:hypothetical protein